MNDFAEYDPFEPIFIWEWDGCEYILDSEPMTEDDWDEWLKNE